MPEHRASSGGVRSLRAMFEQSSDEGATPEARGRSPAPGGGSKVSPESAVSPRPMSKVRTSFVGVEFTEQLGRVLSRGDSAHGASSRGMFTFLWIWGYVLDWDMGCWWCSRQRVVGHGGGC